MHRNKFKNHKILNFTVNFKINLYKINQNKIDFQKINCNKIKINNKMKIILRKLLLQLNNNIKVSNNLKKSYFNK